MAVRRYGVAVGEFDGDGFADIAAANFGSDTIGVLLNNGGGIFRDLTTYPTGSGPDGLAAADLNHDGKLDLAVSNFNSNSVSLLLGNGDGTFQPQSSLTGGAGPGSCWRPTWMARDIWIWQLRIRRRRCDGNSGEWRRHIWEVLRHSFQFERQPGPSRP